MKTRLLLILTLISALTVAAETRRLPVEFGKKSNHGVPERTPLRYPSLELTFNDENETLEIICNDTDDGEVSLYDSTGLCIDYSPTLNSTFSLPQSISYPVTIYIESDTWIATGILNL